MDCSTPGFPIHHQHLELAQTHVRRVGDAIKPSHILLPILHSSPIFASIRVFSNELTLLPGGQSIGASVSVLLMNVQGWFPLGLTNLISLLPKGLSGVFSRTKFENINSSVLNLLYSATFTSVHVSRGCSESTSPHASSFRTYSEEHWGARERIMQRRSRELKWTEQNPSLLGERINDHWSSDLLGPKISLSI